MGRYRFTPEDEVTLVSFRPVLQNVDLDTVNRKAAELASYAKKSGVYCWVMRWREARYKVYVGRTKSLPRRLKEYGNQFQPGVPNDYKLRHFQRWMREEFVGAQLDLYFVESGDHNALETAIVRKIKPFINERMHGDRDAFVAASWLFYRDSFERRLAKRQTQMAAAKPVSVTRRWPRRTDPAQDHRPILRSHGREIDLLTLAFSNPGQIETRFTSC